MIINALSFDFADTLFPHRPREIARILEGVAAYLQTHLPPFAYSDFHTKYLEIRDAQFAQNRATLQENDFVARLDGCIRHLDPTVGNTDNLVAGCVQAYTDTFLSVMAMPPWLPDFFATLSAQYPVCVVSNYPLSAPITQTLAQCGITPYLKAVIVSADIGFIKPHPRLFDAALAALGNPPPETVIHIGDDWDADILGAGSMGIKTVYTRQWRDLPDKHYLTGDLPPLAEIDDLRDLPALLTRLADG